MKYFYLVLLGLSMIVSCKNGITEAQKQAISEDGAYAKSAGRMNTLTIVMENHLWEGKLGDAVRKVLAGNVAGLPQEEPLFTIRQMPKTAFSGFARKSRAYITFNEGVKKSYSLSKNKFARPQIGIHVTGYTDDEVIANFLDHKKDIINTFKALEITHKQSFFKRPLELKDLKEKLGYNLRVPKAYRVAKDSANFVWLRKNIPQGSLNLVLYNVDKTFFKDSLSIVQNIIEMRNKIGGDHMPVNEGGRFITEAAFSPYMSNVRVGGLPAFETRGTWEVQNMFMAGPFVNYVINDRESDQFMVLEGFVFAPTITKRDYVFELEAIIKTIKFN